MCPAITITITITITILLLPVLWAGRINEEEEKYKNETEVRGILAIQVSRLPSI